MKKLQDEGLLVELGELLDYEQPTNYIVKSEEYNDSYSVPVLTAGKSFIKGYTNENFGLFENLPAIIFDDFTTATQLVNFKFKVKSSAMKILVPVDRRLPIQYLFYALQVHKIRADTHKRYWISEGTKLKIPFPPLPIQRAIVAKIEELLSDLDQGIADLKKAQSQLKVYRQAVLKKAFEGEWESCKFEQIALAIDPQPSHRTPPIVSNGIPFVSIKDIENNKIKFDNARKVSADVLKEHLKRYTLKEGDFIIGKIGTIGNPVKITLPQKYSLSANVVLIQPTNVNANFLYYYFKSDFIEKQFNEGKKATTQSAFGIQKVRNLSIILPPMQTQQQIVKEIESRLSVCDEVEQTIKENLQKSQVLRQSILKKAFEGKLLTESEIKKCEQEADYEPASVLLERIKQEKKKK